MLRQAAVAALLCCLCLALAGCWSRRELNELSITVGLGIDKTGDQYTVSTQVVDPGQVATRAAGSGTRVPVTVYRETGPSILEALRKMTTIAPRRIYLSHLRMLIIGEEMARSGISEALDFLSRGHETRTDFFIAIAKGSKAVDILNVLTPLEKIPANNLFLSLETSAKFWSPTHGIYLDELINGLAGEGKSPAVTGIRIKGAAEKGDVIQNIQSITPPAELEYAGLAAFKKDKLIGWLNETESKGFNYIQGFVKETAGHLDCPNGGRIVTDVIRTSTKVKGKVIDGKPAIDIILYAEGDVAEVACGIDLQNPDSLPALNKIINENYNKLIKKTVYKAQKEFKTDFIGFGDVFRKSHPKEWDSWKDDWQEMFVSLPVNVRMDYRIRRIGTITNSLKQEMKE
ncbi:Ger(x)C family spore germination protein [Paenibacillus mesophilus]|uniref:Ger(x)C family spore germination protein n=1 Tax=Paenibacillus mesophilus TaxID=2582849 RepID=UPI00110D2AC7|nr:Ger(x)C family spore germination protein [Paenibacillus mesophilus]TMV49639.1 Ger(x)C family spore germination protein [Paenibacillus mesophilus]